MYTEQLNLLLSILTDITPPSFTAQQALQAVEGTLRALRAGYGRTDIVPVEVVS